MSDLNWIKSSYSTGSGANCVEIAVLPNGGRVIRDSKNPTGAVLTLNFMQWMELIKHL
jgi:hypothetical protein